jgi:predicted nucleotidyltransferase
MSSVIQRLSEKGLISPPPWLPKNVHYEAVTGSVAYGVSNAESDYDVYGFCIPRKDDVFPHLRGEIPGFGRQIQRFDQYIQHHVDDAEERKKYDLTIFGIVKFFSLCMENNPNMVDVLFVPANLILYSSSIGQMVREKRRIFLHKGSWPKYKGYSYSQQSKLHAGTTKAERFRAALLDMDLPKDTIPSDIDAEIESRNLDKSKHGQ